MTPSRPVRKGALLREQGRFGEAERELRRAVSLAEKGAAPMHSLTADYVSCLAEVLADQGKLADAEQLHRRALETFNAHADDDAIELHVGALVRYADMLERMGRLASAREVFLGAMQLGLRVPARPGSDEDRARMQVVRRCAAVCVKLGEDDDAMKLLTEVLHKHESLSR